MTCFYQVRLQHLLSERDRHAYWIGSREFITQVSHRLFKQQQWAFTDLMEQRHDSWFEFVYCFPDISEGCPKIMKIYWQRFFEIEAVLQFRRLGIRINENEKGELLNLKETTTLPVVKQFIQWMKYERELIQKPELTIQSFLTRVNKYEPSVELIERMERNRVIYEFLISTFCPSDYKIFLPRRELNANKYIHEDESYEIEY